MSGYGFGPQSPRAVTVRPAAPADAYGQQTYFADASVLGAKDGTVIPASWLNMVIGQLLFICQQAGLAVSADLNSDSQLYNAVRAIAQTYGGAPKVAAPLTVSPTGVLGLDFTGLQTAQTEQLVADIVADPAAVAALSAAISAGSSVTVVNDLTTGGTTAALSAQQGVVLAGLVQAAQTLAAASLAKSGGTMTGPIAMGANNITGLANGSAASDAAAFGQIPVAGTITPVVDGTAAVGTSAKWAHEDHVHPTDTSRAPLNNANLTGTPTAPTVSANDNSTKIANTAYADNAATTAAANATDPTARATANAALPKAGGTMSGAIGMGGNAITSIANGSAATDAAAFGQIPVAGTAIPSLDGVAAAGSSAKWAHEDHIHPMPRLDQVSAPTVAVAMGSQKITGLANGVAATDAAAIGQIPVVGVVTPAMDGVAAIGASGKWADSAHVHPTDTSLLQKTGGTMTGPIAMGANNITGLANGSAASDAAAFGQIPVAGTITPVVDGTAAVGTSAKWAHEDHVHPTDTSRVSVSSIINDLVTGGTAVPLSAEQGKVLNQLILTGVGTTSTYATVAARDAATNINNGDIAYLVDNGSSTWELQIRLAGAWVKLIAGNDLSASVAGAVQKDGSVAMTGALPMGANKITGLANGVAATDAATVGQLPAAGTATPAIDGAATVGTSAKWAHEDHIHPMPRLDQVSSPTAAVALNAQKITGLANGSAATDAAAFGQIPVVGTTTPAMDGTAVIGSTGHWSDAGHVHPTDTSRAPLNSANLTGTPTAPTPAANDNSTKIATTAYADNAATTAAANATDSTARATANAALPRAGGTMSGAIAMGGNSITGLANGSAATDAAAFGQIPVAGTVTPALDGVAATGTSGKWAHEDHVHPMPRLDQVSAPTAAVAMGSQKITALANGAAATDAVAFGQLGSAAFLSVGTGANQVVQMTAADKLPAVDGSLLTGVVATDATKLPLAGGTMSGAIAMGANKIAGLANGSVATDAAAFGQIPVASSTAPAALGTAAVGVGTTFARADHVHASELTAGSVANAILANMAANTIKGALVAGAPVDLTATQATSILNTFVASGASNAKGLVPAPGATAGTTKFLREDATWVIPSATPSWTNITVTDTATPSIQSIAADPLTVNAGNGSLTLNTAAAAASTTSILGQNTGGTGAVTATVGTTSGTGNVIANVGQNTSVGLAGNVTAIVGASSGTGTITATIGTNTGGATGGITATVGTTNGTGNVTANVGQNTSVGLAGNVTAIVGASGGTGTITATIGANTGGGSGNVTATVGTTNGTGSVIANVGQNIGLSSGSVVANVATTTGSGTVQAYIAQSSGAGVVQTFINAGSGTGSSSVSIGTATTKVVTTHNTSANTDNALVVKGVTIQMNISPTAATSTSDGRLKDIVGLIDPAEAAQQIEDLSPLVFQWKSDVAEVGADEAPRVHGYIAQAVRGVIPDAIGFDKSEAIEIDDGLALNLNRETINTVNVAAVKWLVGERRRMSAEISDLRSMVEEFISSAH